MNVTRYKVLHTFVITEESIQKLVEEVNKHTKAGWIPLGGMTMLGTYAAQTLVQCAIEDRPKPEHNYDGERAIKLE